MSFSSVQGIDKSDSEDYNVIRVFGDFCCQRGLYLCLELPTLAVREDYTYVLNCHSAYL